uniref:CDK5 regulatory subunit associated protein 1 like 1 n=2 Tax=Bos TaxID=9903 RepID=A0A4W2FFP9_BOBOX
MPSASCDTFLNDIEDIVSQEDSKPQDRHFSRKHVVPKVRRRNTQKYLQEENSPPSDSTIPGIQKIWIRTWGCSHNNSDGEYMAGQLAAYGYKITGMSSYHNKKHKATCVSNNSQLSGTSFDCTVIHAD